MSLFWDTPIPEFPLLTVPEVVKVILFILHEAIDTGAARKTEPGKMGSARE
jgi:hypothetical protein